jgi:hypothetical protein
MKKYILTLALLTSICSIKSFAQHHKKTHRVKKTHKTSHSAMSETSIPFVVARNYFVKNTYQDGTPVSPKITSEVQLESILGYATVMGENGQPTPIDFSKQYAILVIGHTTDKATSMTASSLKQQAGKLIFTYKYQEGAKQSYTMLPFLLVIVDKKYEGEVTLVKE